MTPEQREELGKIAFDNAKTSSPNPGLIFWENVSNGTQEKYRLAAEAVWNKAVEHCEQNWCPNCGLSGAVPADNGGYERCECRPAAPTQEGE